MLYEKLKRLKPTITKWNRDIFGWIYLQVYEKVDNLNALDRLLVEHHGEDIKNMVEDRYKVSGEIWKTLNLKECILRQKSRKHWLKEGNELVILHNSLKVRRRRNAIIYVTGRNGLMEGVAEVKEEVKYHFEEFFGEKFSNRPMNFKSLSEENRRCLDRPLSDTKVKEVVWACDGKKSPGLNEFSLEFYKQC